MFLANHELQNTPFNTGMPYNYFRDCDPSVGRYTESDPIGLRGGINLYQYVRANPIALVDATGRTPAGPILAGIFWGCVRGCAAGIATACFTCAAKKFRGGAKIKECHDKCFDACELGDGCALGCLGGAFSGGLAGAVGFPESNPGFLGGGGATAIFKGLFGFSVCDYLAGLGMPFGGLAK